MCIAPRPPTGTTRGHHQGCALQPWAGRAPSARGGSHHAAPHRTSPHLSVSRRRPSFGTRTRTGPTASDRRALFRPAVLPTRALLVGIIALSPKQLPHIPNHSCPGVIAGSRRPTGANFDR